MIAATGPWRSVAADEWIYLALVTSLPVMQPLHVEIGGHAVVPADALFVATCAALAIAVVARRRRVPWTGWHALLALYLAASVASTLRSDEVRRSAVKLAGVADLVGLAFLTTVFVTSVDALRRAAMAWIAGLAITVAAALAGIALFEAAVAGARNIFLYSYGSLPPGPYPRVMALFLNANMLCSYVAAGILILIAARAAGWIGAAAFAALMAGGIVTAVFSLSPGLGGLALAAALWYAASLRRRSPVSSRVLVAAGWACAAAMFVAVTVSPVGLSARTIAAGHVAPSSRVMAWQGAWATFRAHPWTGKGVGLEAANVHYLDASGAMEALTDAHNAWLSLLAQQGIAGLAAFVLVLWYVLRRAGPLVAEGPALAVMQTGLLLGLAGAFLYPSLAGSFESTRHVWVLMGLAAAARSLAGQPTTPVPAARAAEGA